MFSITSMLHARIKPRYRNRPIHSQSSGTHRNREKLLAPAAFASGERKAMRKSGGSESKQIWALNVSGNSFRSARADFAPTTCRCLRRARFNGPFPALFVSPVYGEALCFSLFSFCAGICTHCAARSTLGYGSRSAIRFTRSTPTFRLTTHMQIDNVRAEWLSLQRPFLSLSRLFFAGCNVSWELYFVLFVSTIWCADDGLIKTLVLFWVAWEVSTHCMINSNFSAP